jgi:double-stranded uracil-DNA glycosylase
VDADRGPARLTAADLKAARALTVPDVLPGPDDPPLRVLFCGINPGLVSAATGHHFARPGNRFWPALHAAGITPRRLAPAEDEQLLEHGVGVTNLCARPTREAAELTAEELREGAAALDALVAEHAPGLVAVLGLTAWRAAFGRPGAGLGAQEETLGGRPVWVLPNPSGLNAHYQLPDLARLYGEAWEASAGHRE